MKATTLFIFMQLFVFAAFAQSKREGIQQKRDEIKAQKVAYITQKINLTAEEAQKFWPIYNEYTSKRDELHRAKRVANKQNHAANESLTEAQAEVQLKNYIENQKKELELEIEYIAKFKAIVGAQKVVLLHKAEHDFKEELLKRLRDNN